jgi:hypothetical protein
MRWNDEDESGSPRDNAVVRRVLAAPVAVHLWLVLTLTGLVAAVVAGDAMWAVAGWALGGVAAVIAAAVKTRRPPTAR